MDENTPLSVVQEFVRQGRETKLGVHCPGCDQLCKNYKRNLTDRMARSLLILVHLFGASNDYIHVEEITRRLGKTVGGDFGHLARYGMTRESNVEGYRGYWMPTEKGRLWARGKIQVPKYIWMYNDETLGFEGPDIPISIALASPFDYEAVVKG